MFLIILRLWAECQNNVKNYFLITKLRQWILSMNEWRTDKHKNGTFKMGKGSKANFIKENNEWILELKLKSPES